MIPVKFKESNIVFAEHQPEYLPLPAYKHNSERGEVITCWKLSFIERLKILFRGTLWLSLLSFNKPLTPSFLSVNKKDVFA